MTTVTMEKDTALKALNALEWCVEEVTRLTDENARLRFSLDAMRLAFECRNEAYKELKHRMESLEE